jgi:hypothetical protein
MNIIFIILLTFNLNACNTHVQSSLIKRETIYWSKEYIVDQIFNNYDNHHNKRDGFLNLQEFYNFVRINPDTKNDTVWKKYYDCCDCSDKINQISKQNFELWITGILYYDSLNETKIMWDNKISKKELEIFLDNDLIYNCLQNNKKYNYIYKKDAEKYLKIAQKKYKMFIIP